MLTKWIGRKQTVAAHMPTARMANVIGMAKDSDAHSFALDRSDVINPFRCLSPGIVCRDVRRLLTMRPPFLASSFIVPATRRAEGPLFRIAEGDVALGGNERLL